jgi:transposase
MEILHDRCCGLDVHKSSITACVLFEQKHKPQRHLQRFGCTTRDLLELVSWLKGFGVRHVAMESPELMDSSVEGQRDVESLKAEVDDQLERVLDILGLLFSLLSTDELNPSCVFKVAC